MSAYALRLRSHLAAYKRQRLGVSEDGHWRGNGKPYPHILPEALKRLNILETVRREFWHHPGLGAVELHGDFRHLNSSQALAFNLFFPYFGLGLSATGPLLHALGLPQGRVTDWGFERILQSEEGTHVDFYVRLDSGTQAVVEVKLSEVRFGPCSRDDAHRRKLDRIYRGRLTGKVVDDSLDEGFFFRNYQLLRNISYADVVADHHVIFLIPRENAGLDAYARAFLDKALLPRVRGNVRVVSLEDVVRSLSADRWHQGARVGAHLELFREKYILPDPVH